MAKASEFARDILLKIVHTGAEQPVQAIDASDVLTAINDTLSEWEGVGISLGFTLLTDLGDEVTIPTSANRAVKTNVAVYVADQFCKQVEASTAAMARESYNRLVNQFITVGAATLPSIMPRGAGNSCGVYDTTFYPGPVDGTLDRETGGAILTEDDTE